MGLGSDPAWDVGSDPAWDWGQTPLHAPIDAAIEAMKKKVLETPSIQSLGRGLTILEAVAESTGLLGIDRSSVFPLANTLRQRRFLANPDGRKDYILGPSIWRLSRKYGRNVLITFCREHLRALSDTTGETAHLAVRDGRQALFIDCHVATGQVLTVSGQTGELVPLHATAHAPPVTTSVCPLTKSLSGLQKR